MTFLNKTWWKTTKRPGGQWLNMQESDRPAHTEGVMLGMLHQFPMEQAGAWVSDRTGEVLANGGIPSLAGHCSANTCWMNGLGKNSPVRCSCPWILSTGAILMAVLFQRWDCWVVWVWVWICTDLCAHSVSASGWHRGAQGDTCPHWAFSGCGHGTPAWPPTHAASLSQTCATTEEPEKAAEQRVPAALGAAEAVESMAVVAEWGTAPEHWCLGDSWDQLLEKAFLLHSDTLPSCSRKYHSGSNEPNWSLLIAGSLSAPSYTKTCLKSAVGSQR